MESDFQRLIEKVKSIQGSDALFVKNNAHALDELATRLETLKSNYLSLCALNDRYIVIDPLRVDMSFDPETGVMTFKKGEEILSSFKINRADPLVPVRLMSQSDITAFLPAKSESGDSEEVKNLRNQISSELEGFYYNASKAWDLVGKSLLKKKDSKFIGIKMVRNKLIEHTEHGDIFSFGASKEAGPTVKPIKLSTRREKSNDKGLNPNTKEFVEEVEKRLDGILTLTS